jgi:hypothetical protein
VDWGDLEVIMAPTGPPALLERLFGDSKVVTLHQLLLRLASLSSEASHLRHTLVTALDHPDYSSRLLANTFCVADPGAPPLRDGFSLKQVSNQTELINRAIEALLGAGRNNANVLAYGCRKVPACPRSGAACPVAPLPAFHPLKIPQFTQPSCVLLVLARRSVRR